MSSHHFVRDKQEPALIVANGASCSDTLLHQLLEWNPYVLVLDQAIHRFMEKGLKADALLGDFDRNLDFESIRQRQHPIEIIHTPDQEKTDLEKGIEHLIRNGHSSANIVWATGLRADHTLNNLSSMAKYSDRINLVMLDNWSRILCLPRSFEKWVVKDSLLSLMPLGVATGVRTEGLKYNLNREDLHLSLRTSSSNQSAGDGFIKIEHTGGHLLLMECHDESNESF